MRVVHITHELCKLQSLGDFIPSDRIEWWNNHKLWRITSPTSECWRTVLGDSWPWWLHHIDVITIKNNHVGQLYKQELLIRLMICFVECSDQILLRELSSMVSNEFLQSNCFASPRGNPDLWRRKNVTLVNNLRETLQIMTANSGSFILV